MNIDIELLENAWTATATLRNGKSVDVWYTCWNSIKHLVTDIVSVSSDYPRRSLK